METSNVFLSKVVSSLEELLQDCEKFDNGNVSAGLRIRKQAQGAVRELKVLRKLVSEKRVVFKTEKAARKAAKKVENTVV